MSTAENVAAWTELTRSESEDILEAVNADKWNNYESISAEINTLLYEDNGLEVYAESMVIIYSKMNWGGSWNSLLSQAIGLGIVYYQRKKKREKVRTVLKDKLEELFDINLRKKIQPMNYENLRITCDTIGGDPEYFSFEDIAYIYSTVLRYLMGGPIRRKCNELDIWEYANDVLDEVKKNEREFRVKYATRQIR